MPPLFGLVANHVSIRLLPIFLIVFVLLMVFMLEQTNRTVGDGYLEEKTLERPA